MANVESNGGAEIDNTNVAKLQNLLRTQIAHGGPDAETAKQAEKIFRRSKRTLGAATFGHRLFTGLVMAAGIGYGFSQNEESEILKTDRVNQGEVLALAAAPVVAAVSRKGAMLRNQKVSARIYGTSVQNPREHFPVRANMWGLVDFTSVLCTGVGTTLLSGSANGVHLAGLETTQAQVTTGAITLAIGLAHLAMDGPIKSAFIDVTAGRLDEAVQDITYRRGMTHTYNHGQAPYGSIVRPLG